MRRKTSNRQAISIVFPFRDEERFIAESIASILAQTEQNWELIAIDDHSTDRSAAILGEAAGMDDRVEIVTSRGEGLVDALDHGLALARAPLVARMDADDLMTPDRLEVQSRMLQDDPDLVVAGSRVHLFGTTARTS